MRNQLVILSILALHMNVHAAISLFGSYLPEFIEFFGKDIVAISVTGNIAFFAFGALSPLAGYMTDKFGCIKTLLTCSGGMALCSFGMYFMGDNYLFFSSFLIINGILAGLYHPAGVAYLGKIGSAKGKIMSIHGITGMFGLILPTLLASELEFTKNFKGAYFVVGIMFAVSFVMFIFGEELKPQKKADTKNSISVSGDTRRSIIMIFLIYLVTGMVYRAVLVFLPLHISEVMKVGQDIANAESKWFYICGGFGLYACSLFIDKVKVKTSMKFTYVISGLALFSVAALDEGFKIPLFIFGFVWFMTQVQNNLLVVEEIHESKRGIIFGWSFFVSFGIGSFITSISGLLADMSGTRSVFIMSGAICFLGLALLSWIEKARKNENKLAR